MNVLVVYDISDDDERGRLFLCLEGYGQPVQRSVFECGDLSQPRVLELRCKLDDFLLEEDDSIILYFLCADCVKDLERIPPRRQGFDEIDYIV